MTAVVVPTATEADWLDARRKGISASEIAPLMGLSNWTSPYALFHRKRGNLPEQEDNLAMAVGRHMESFVASLFAEQHPEFAMMGSGRELYLHPERRWQMATPDRLLCETVAREDDYTGRVRVGYGDLVAVLECKTSASYDGWGDDGTDEIPVAYRCQVLWQCDVLGVDAWFVACLFMHSRKLRIYHGVIDEEARADLQMMRQEAIAFLRCVEQGIEPAVDWCPATGAALKALNPDVEERNQVIPHQLAQRWLAACRRLDEAKQRKATYEHQIRARLGSARRAVDGVQVVARRDVYPVKEHVRKASITDRVVPVQPKEIP